jgi:hypothetical protein
MEHNQVSEITTNTRKPTGLKVVGSHWVLAIKDFQESYAQVVSDTTIHILMGIKTIFKVEAGQLDIETACLHVTLAEDL